MFKVINNMKVRDERGFALVGLLIVIATMVGIVLVSPAMGHRVVGEKPTITKDEVIAAKQAWCDALEKIARTHREGGDARAVAYRILTDAYDYDKGTVFFKPTLTFGPNTFRNTKEGALSYFVGGNPKFPEDKGFALKPWVEVWFTNKSIQIHDNIAITMGNVHLRDKAGNEVMVDKSWVFREDADGRLRIINHFSALPFAPAK
jgi:hypothetical protein